MIRCVWVVHRVAGAAVLEDPQARACLALAPPARRGTSFAPAPGAVIPAVSSGAIYAE
jgi:hypothetical protein